MHPVKFSRVFFFPSQARVDVRSFARAGGWWGYRIAGTSVGPTRLEPLLGIFPLTGVFGHPTCTPESFFHDAPTASRAADDADDFTRYLQVPEQARPPPESI